MTVTGVNRHGVNHTEKLLYKSNDIYNGRTICNIEVTDYKTASKSDRTVAILKAVASFGLLYLCNKNIRYACKGTIRTRSLTNYDLTRNYNIEKITKIAKKYAYFPENKQAHFETQLFHRMRIRERQYTLDTSITENQLSQEAEFKRLVSETEFDALYSPVNADVASLHHQYESMKLRPAEFTNSNEKSEGVLKFMWILTVSHNDLVAAATLVKEYESGFTKDTPKELIRDWNEFKIRHAL